MPGLGDRENDHLTRNFLQWFVAEQREGLSSAETLLKMVQRAEETGLLQIESYLSLTRLPRRPRQPLGRGKLQAGDGRHGERRSARFRHLYRPATAMFGGV